MGSTEALPSAPLLIPLRHRPRRPHRARGRERGQAKAVPPSHRLCLSPPQRDLAMPYSDGRTETGEGGRDGIWIVLGSGAAWSKRSDRARAREAIASGYTFHNCGSMKHDAFGVAGSLAACVHGMDARRLQLLNAQCSLKALLPYPPLPFPTSSFTLLARSAPFLQCEGESGLECIGQGVLGKLR